MPRKARRMGWTYELIVAAVIVLAVASVFIVLTASRPIPAPGELRFSVETISAACQTVEPGEGDIRAVGNSIVVTQPITTSTPCYEATATVELRGGGIEATIGTRPTADVCIQCIGQIVARLTISDLADGLYGFQLAHPGGAAITTIMIPP